MLELTKTIWEGEDYVPQVWDDWLADPHGQLSVAEIGGRVVGLGKLTRLAPGEWWLEGLRVDPQWQGRGIGRALHEYHVGLWRKMGDSSALRLFIRFPAAPYESLPDMLRDVRRLAAARGKLDVYCLAPVVPAMMQAYGAAGYERAWDDSMYLFEART